MLFGYYWNGWLAAALCLCLIKGCNEFGLGLIAALDSNKIQIIALNDL